MMNKQMHRTKCDKCGNKCEVPFKPTGSKPIFCSDCFQGKDDRGGRGGGRSRFGDRDRDRGRGRDRDRDREMFKATCDECNSRCEVPFKPSGDKPVKCDKCFSKGGGRGKGGDFDKQFEMINTKLDKILKVITPTVTVDLDEKKSKKELKKEEKPKKEAKKAAVKKPAAKKETKKKAPAKKAATKKTAAKKPAKKKVTAKKK
jgi:CxxC-x17-CxxC domain-containing protein